MNADQIGAKLVRRAEQTLTMLALEIDRQLRLVTPVDTGHAKRNWIPSVGQPNTAEANDGSLHAKGVADVMRYKLSQGALWVANVVPYIRRLNYGSSDQEPAGFVERAIDLAFQVVIEKTGSQEIIDMRRAFHDEQGGDAAESLAGAYSPFGDD